MQTLKGGCQCGAVEYLISDALLYAGYCHCSECRRWTGAPFSASGGVVKSDFSITKGETNLSCYTKGKESLAYFCKTCSSIVYGDMNNHDMIYFMLGTLMDMPTLRPQWHAYTGSKVDWYEIKDELPQYDTKVSS